MTNLMKTMVLGGLCVFLGTGIGSAITITPGGGTGGGQNGFASLSDATQGSAFAGNDSNTIDASFSMFGMTGWVLADKNADTTSGDQVITFTNAPTNGAASGTWGISGLAGLSHIVINLKAGNGFTAFLLDTTVANPLSGVWASDKGLSHASIYYNGTPVVNTPDGGATLALLGLGLVGIGGLKKKLGKKHS